VSSVRELESRDLDNLNSSAVTSGWAALARVAI
jgi:hypothetical protein